MRLQRLKMTGFKSFADSVTIDFNPGVTAIVGPNGSGKSNVVDALAWVLGAQSPRLLRLTKMEELIYAGGDGRQPLGRAEVTIEFDNTDQQVSLPMAEIAMSRAITRNGDAQYRLNGAQCRLVDLVDTLSEANLGKTQHVIISQGEIESLANAKGDEIRAVLEDAAQVSTLRRRLGQSQRHVESVTQSLNEVALKERELRRRIKPLRSQVTLYEQREQLTRRRDAIALWVMRRRLEGYAEQAEEAKRALLGVTTRLEELGVDHDETEVRQSVLEPLLLRLRSLRQEASDLRGEVLEAMAPLNKLESTIARSDAELAMVTDELGRIDEAKAQVLVRIDELEQAGEALAARRGDLAAKRREAEEGAPRRPVELEALVADLRGQRAQLVAEQRHRLAERERLATEEETRRTRRQKAQARLAEAEAEIATLEVELQEHGRQREELASALVEHRHALAEAEAQLGEYRGKDREFQGQLRALSAQVNSLIKLAGAEAASSLGRTLVPREGLAEAVAAVLGELSQAHVYTSLPELLSALDRSSADSFVGYVPSPSSEPPTSEAVAAFFEQAPSWLASQFGAVRLVDDVLAHLRNGDTEGVIVDRKGTMFRDGLLRVGASQQAVAQLQLATHQRELDEHTRESQEVARQIAELEPVVRSLREAVASDESTDKGLSRRSEQVTTRLAALGSEVQKLTLELEFLAAPLEASDVAQVVSDDEIAAIDQRLGVAIAELQEQQQLVEAYERTRGEFERSDVSIRLEAADLAAQLKAAGERLSELESRETTLKARAESMDRDHRAPLAKVRSLIAQLGTLADEIGAQASRLIPLEARVAEARHEEERANALAEERRQARARERETLGNQRLTYATEESRLRSRLLAEEEAAVRATGLSLAHIRQATLPEGVAPTTAQGLLTELEEQIVKVGQVNPLAALELAELEDELERFRVETADVREAHRLAEDAFIVLEREMATRITEMVGAVSVEFDRLMERLFRGGTGAVVLDDPAEPLTSPINLDIKIPAKRVRRLGLLSGGERSLVSLAFLFAVLKVRPVPFVVLDEVEAALDDKNLSAFAGLVEDVSRDHQVIVVTHQRRTMEVANSLVGVSMSPRGFSTVVRHVLIDAFAEPGSEPLDDHANGDEEIKGRVARVVGQDVGQDAGQDGNALQRIEDVNDESDESDEWLG